MTYFSSNPGIYRKKKKGNFDLDQESSKKGWLFPPEIMVMYLAISKTIISGSQNWETTIGI